jgi:hypothetical protein
MDTDFQDKIFKLKCQSELKHFFFALCMEKDNLPNLSFLNVQRNEQEIRVPMLSQNGASNLLLKLNPQGPTVKEYSMETRTLDSTSFLDFDPSFLNKGEADKLFKHLLEDIPWRKSFMKSGENQKHIY